jgi:hypothetical protein
MKRLTVSLFAVILGFALLSSPSISEARGGHRGGGHGGGGGRGGGGGGFHLRRVRFRQILIKKDAKSRRRPGSFTMNRAGIHRSK